MTIFSFSLSSSYLKFEISFWICLLPVQLLLLHDFRTNCTSARFQVAMWSVWCQNGRVSRHHLKGQCQEVFGLWLFFIKPLLLIPFDMSWKNFQFFVYIQGVICIRSWSVFTSGHSVHGIFLLWFFHQTTSPSPGRRVEKVFRFFFDYLTSPYIHHWGVEALHHCGVVTPWCFHHRRVDLNWFTKKPIGANYTKGTNLPCE